MTDGSEPRYTPAIRDEIERRWQELARPGAPFGWPKTSFGIISDLGADPYSHCADGWHTWLSTHLHAQEDIQILLEGLATAERSLLAATARIAEVESLRREDADRYTDALRRVGEANLELRGMLEAERAEWREWDQMAKVEIRDLEERLAMGQKREQDLETERDMFRQRWAEEQEARKAAAVKHQEDLAISRKMRLAMAMRSRDLLRRLLESGVIPEGELLRAVREEVG